MTKVQSVSYLCDGPECEEDSPGPLMSPWWTVRKDTSLTFEERHFCCTNCAMKWFRSPMAWNPRYTAVSA